jgi:hypothetical protein
MASTLFGTSELDAEEMIVRFCTSEMQAYSQASR